MRTLNAKNPGGHLGPIEPAAPGAPELLTVAEAARALRCGRWKLYQLMRRGLLGYVTVGDRRLVPAAMLRAYVDAHRAPAPAPLGVGVDVAPERTPGDAPEPGARSPEPARARGAEGPADPQPGRASSMPPSTH